MPAEGAHPAVPHDPALKLAPPTRAPTLAGRLKHLAAERFPRSLLMRRGPADRRIALTFDDGPHEMTDAYLEVLERFRARATFFVVGQESGPRKDALARIAARGHELSGHGFTHTPFPRMGVRTLLDELRRTDALLPPARTLRPLVRPPYGATSMRSLAVCAAAGYTTVLWSRDSDDCRTTSPDEIVERLAPGVVQPGEIVLLHEGQSWTLDALPRILGNLTSAGWRCVTIGDMLTCAE